MRSSLPKPIWEEADSLIEGIQPALACSQVSPRPLRQAAASAMPAVLEDLEAIATRDPAARDGPSYVWSSYLSFRALLAYRVAHAIHKLAFVGHEEPQAKAMACAARLMAEQAKARTGVDIHPAASIGRRMVIDHGWGTVIGEQAQVGDDCYFLQNVTLGCRRIGAPYEAGEQRHPTIGNRVILAGDVLVFGPVTIGDDCRIDPGARITTDIPPGAHVRVVTKLQITQPGRPTAWPDAHGTAPSARASAIQEKAGK
jgi:serine O-acetyltransferase